MDQIVESRPQRIPRAERFSPYFALFVAGPVLLIFCIVQAIGPWMNSHAKDFWAAVAPWLNGICLTVLGVCLMIVGWAIYTALMRHHQETRERKARVDLLAEHAQISRQTSLLIEEARTNGDNIKLSFSAEGRPQTVEVIRASTILAQYAPRLEAMTERAALPSPEQQKGMLPARFPEPEDFLNVLAQGFEPSPAGIYLAKTVEGSIVEKEQDLTHIALTGPSGGGKTNTTRLITSQLLATGADVYLASPNFAPIKLNGHRLEDWRPIMRWLKAPPAQSAEEIKALLESFLRLFERRKQAEQDYSPRRGKDVFLILGEWPGIAARVKDASQMVGLLLRESRQYGIHLLTEMQDALVKTTQIDSGMIENLRTGAYFGGDKITAKRVLDLKAGQDLSEEGLGKQGALWLRSYTHGLNPARVPYFSNQAMYELLGYPPDPVPDTDIYDERQIKERYAPSTAVDISKSRFSRKSARFYSLPTVPMESWQQDQQNVRQDQEERPGNHVFSPDLAGVSRVVDANKPAGQDRQTGPLFEQVAMPLNTPEKPVPADFGESPDDLGPNDLRFTPEQEEEFLRRWQKNPGRGVKTYLREMNGGHGLGNAYSKYARRLLIKKGFIQE